MSRTSISQGGRLNYHKPKNKLLAIPTSAGECRKGEKVFPNAMLKF